MMRAKFSIAGLMGFVLFVALGIGGLKAANPIWASVWYSLAFVVLIAGVLLSVQARGRKRAFWVGFSVAGWAYFVFAFVVPNIANYENSPQLFPTLLLEKAYALFFPNGDPAVTITFNPVTFSPGTPPTLVGSPSLASPPAAVSSPSTLGTSTSLTVTTSPVSPTSVVVGPTPSPVTPNISPGTTNAASGLSMMSFMTATSGTVVPLSMGAKESVSSFNHVGQSMMTLIFAYLGGWFSLFLWTRRERNEANSTPEISPSSP